MTLTLSDAVRVTLYPNSASPPPSTSSLSLSSIISLETMGRVLLKVYALGLLSCPFTNCVVDNVYLRLSFSATVGSFCSTLHIRLPLANFRKNFRVGKTSLMNQYVNKRFSNQYKATIGADLCVSFTFLSLSHTHTHYLMRIMILV